MSLAPITRRATLLPSLTPSDNSWAGHDSCNSWRTGVWAYFPLEDRFLCSASLEAMLGESPGNGPRCLETFLACFDEADQDNIRRALRLAEGYGLASVWEARVVGCAGACDGGALQFHAEAVGRRERFRCFVLGRVRDVADILEAETPSDQRHQLAAEAAAGTAHDLNNLLTAIAGHVELLELGAMDPPSALQEIRGACDRATKLTRGMLRVCRNSESEISTFDLGALIRELLPLLRALVGRRVALHAEVEGHFFIRGNAAQFEYSLMNMAANARDAMPNGGELRLEILASSAIRETTRNQFVLSVSDTGHGMSAEILRRAFEQHFTTKKAGSGLGLAQVRDAVRQAGGQITVNSRPGHGTRIEIALPLAGSPTFS